VIEAAHSLSKKEEIDDKSRLDENVLVSGITYSLQEVRNNDSLIDRMTDQEYEAYDRLVQRLGFQ
jgi:hypothetical protein